MRLKKQKQKQKQKQKKARKGKRAQIILPAEDITSTAIMAKYTAPILASDERCILPKLTIPGEDLVHLKLLKSCTDTVLRKKLQN